MRSFADVVELNRRGSICEHALTVLKWFELWLTWISRERVRISDEPHRAHFLEERFFTGSDDQGRTFGHVRANTPSVIVVMMRNRDVLDRLARNRLFDLLDGLQRDAIVAGSLHHKDVIVEIDKQDVIAAGTGRIDLVCMLRDRRGCR